MAKMNLKRRSALGLLQMHANILEELQRRRIVRSKNNPVGDYAEWLVSEKLDLKLASNSTSGYDAVDSKNIRYQIKGRRRTSKNKSVQMSALRNLNKKDFDFLIGVVFDQDYKVAYAAQIPHKVVKELATFRSHTNAHIMYLRETVFNDKRIKNLTKKLSLKI